MSKKDRITRGLLEIGACWSIRTDRHCDVNDPLEAQIAGKRTYHIHPDASYPHQSDILRFRNLNEIASYIKARRAVGNCGSDEEAMKLMEEFWASRS